MSNKRHKGRPNRAVSLSPIENKQSGSFEADPNNSHITVTEQESVLKDKPLHPHLPKIKPNKGDVFRKLKWFYEKNYPEFDIMTHLYKKSQTIPEPSSRSPIEEKMEEDRLLAEARRQKMLKSANHTHSKYKNVASRIDNRHKPFKLEAKNCSFDNNALSPMSYNNKPLFTEPTLSIQFVDSTNFNENLTVTTEPQQEGSMPSVLLLKNPDTSNNHFLTALRSPSPALRASYGSPTHLQPLKLLTSYNASLSNVSPPLKPIGEMASPALSFGTTKASLASRNKLSKVASPINLFRDNSRQRTHSNYLGRRGGSFVSNFTKPSRKESSFANQSFDITQNEDPNNVFTLSIPQTRPRIDQGFNLDRKSRSFDTTSPEKIVKKERVNHAEEARKQFDKIKQSLNKTYADIKEEKSPEKIDWMGYHAKKDFGKLQRQLDKGRPRLYGFEDYLFSVYGKDYRLDEFTVAMKPYKIAIDPIYKNAKKDKELKYLINQMQKEDRQPVKM